MSKNFIRAAALALMTATSALALQPANAATDAAAVVKHYAAVAHAKYEDALATAEALEKAVDALIAGPSEETLKAAREAWLRARNPYQETEVYRFGNTIVDEWEGKVNAWPLDEGLIDYVDASYGSESDENALFTANVIANKTIKVDGQDVDATNITPELLSGTLQEAGGIEANVATGYHAIEFLLWGQDLNGTGPGAGNRPYTDFDTKACTNGNCDRRAAYLKAATSLLVSDLEEMARTGRGRRCDQGGRGGSEGRPRGDPYRHGLALLWRTRGRAHEARPAPPRSGRGARLLLRQYPQLAPADAIGIQSAYSGEYTRIDGSKLTGPSLSELVAAKDAALDKEMKDGLATTVEKMQVMAKRAETGEAYDQMIGEGNAEGNATVQAAIDGLIAQAKTVERVIAALDLGTVELEGSDSLDNPGAVFQ